MFGHLQIYRRRERLVVGAADIGLRLAAPLFRAARPRRAAPPRRILLLRLERIGDLLMTLDAIDDVRRAAPAAAIELVVGSWNEDLAARIAGVRVETADAAWLARGAGGLRMAALLRRTAAWRRRRYDLALNFEPDIRSNLLLAASRAARTAGFASGGGGALLDVALDYDSAAHTSANARRLVAAVLDVPPRTVPAALALTAEDRRTAAGHVAGRTQPIVAIHASGGRLVKQWPPERFAALAARLAARGATIVVTGTDADRPMVSEVARAVGPRVIDLAGVLDLPALAAVLERADLLLTGDTGPMHLAAAVGTPVVAIFGPSNPVRYAPADPMHRIVRIDLPCSPCNRIRRPPARCTGIIPDCLTGIDVEMVQGAVERALASHARAGARAGAHRR